MSKMSIWIRVRDGNGNARAYAMAVAMAASTAMATSPEIFVEKGAPSEKTESFAFSKLTLHDSLTAHGTGGDVNNPMTLTPDAGAVIELAPDAGDSVVLRLQGNVRFTNGENALMRFGAGVGKIVSEVWGNCGTYWPKIEISPEALGADEVFRIAELNAGPFLNSSIKNKNAKPVEILFNGGTLNNNVWEGRTLSATELNPIILRGGDGRDICLGPGWVPWRLAGDADHSVATTGACNVVIAQDTRGASNWARVYLDHPIVWGHTGDTVVCGAEIRTDRDDVLPYGPGTGGIVLSSSVWQVDNGWPLTAILDLNGTTQTVNSLDVSVNSCATNRDVSKVACLKFGTANGNGTLKGVVAPNVKVCKVGAGTLTLDGATVTTPDVTGGSLVIVGETTVNGFGDLAGLTPVLPVKDDDANYDESKGGAPKKVMEATGLLAAAPRTVTVAETGTLVCGNEVAEAFERLVKLDAKGAFVKKGTGTLSVRGSESCPQTFSGLVRAAEGRLALSGMGLTNAFWRVTITKWAQNDTLEDKAIGELGLFAADGTRINQKDSGYVYRTDATSATDLEAEQVMVDPAIDYSAENGNKSPSCLFSGIWYNWMQIVKSSSGEKLTEVAITFRLPEGKPSAHSYAFTSVGGIPSSWKIETSPDGVNWTLADQRAAFYETRFSYDFGYYYWYLDGRWGGMAGLPLTFACANEASPFVTIDGAMLRADKDATLDVSAATGAPAGIEVDAATPGGTIVGMPSVRNGTLRIVNLPSGQDRSSLADVASLVTCTGALTADDLATWRVTVNGKATRMGVTMDAEGHVGVTSPGFAMIIR